MATLYELIKEFVEKWKFEHDFHKVTTKTYFRNKTNPEDTANSADELFDRGVNNADYVKVFESIMPLNKCKMDLFGDDIPINKDIKDDFYSLKLILGRMGLISPAALSEIELDKKPKKEKNEFNRKLNSLNAQINKKRSEDDSELRLERVKLYIEHNKIPKKRFRDLELYNSEMSKVDSTNKSK